ncbi:DUF935 family protein [Gordonia sp. ABSL1-1]|uniref:phage portal protein family protein n=1 Tax=Gordonia sp. ABSL1-1 TaxID=3053923 RepID=UPI002573AFF4|nr:DUF935 family protein [Gordonia sp. ABSL1-1]MDL9938692.1 DUF935 family protein [Gordonia sp. ABSL1-1]
MAALPVTESGYVNGDGLNWSQWNRDEKVDALQWPASNHVFSRMASEDGRVASLLQAIGLPIRRTVWRIDQNGASDEVTEFCARDTGLPILGAETPIPTGRSRDRFSWAQHLQWALLMLDYGHSFFEQVYRLGDDGRLHLRKLAPRPQPTISKINVALDGGLVSIEQDSPTLTGEVYGIKPAVIPVNRLVAYVRDPKPGQWVGRSLLRPAYKHWLLKDELMRIEAATARRNGMGVPVVTTADPDDQAQVDSAKEIASGFKGGNHSGVGLPNGWDMKLLGVSGNLPDLRQAIEYHDKQIALAGLAHFLNLDRGGSYALASVQADTFVQSVQTFAEHIAATASAHVIEDLVDLNWGPDEPAPRIVFDEIGSRQDATAAALAMLVQAGLLDPDDVAKRVVRQQLGIPAGDSVETSDVASEPSPPKTTNRKSRTDGEPTLW